MPARFAEVAEGGRRRRRSLGGELVGWGFLFGSWWVAYRAASKGSAMVVRFVGFCVVLYLKERVL
jgi:hypothetical protein